MMNDLQNIKIQELHKATFSLTYLLTECITIDQCKDFEKYQILYRCEYQIEINGQIS